MFPFCRVEPRPVCIAWYVLLAESVRGGILVFFAVYATDLVNLCLLLILCGIQPRHLSNWRSFSRLPTLKSILDGIGTAQGDWLCGKSLLGVFCGPPAALGPHRFLLKKHKSGLWSWFQASV